MRVARIEMAAIALWKLKHGRHNLVSICTMSLDDDTSTDSMSDIQDYRRANGIKPLKSLEPGKRWCIVPFCFCKHHAKDLCRTHYMREYGRQRANETQRRYQQSEKGRAASARYENSEKGRDRKRRYYQRQRQALLNAQQDLNDTQP